MNDMSFDFGLSHSSPARSELTAAKLEEIDRLAEAGRAGEAAQAFETLFSTLLVKEMRRSLPKGFFSGGSSDVYDSWFDEHVGRTIAETGALGFAEDVHASILRTQASEARNEEEQA